MRIGLDGSPLSDLLNRDRPLQNLELGRALAVNYPSDQFQLISPKPFSPQIVEQSDGIASPIWSSLIRSHHRFAGVGGHSICRVTLKRAGLDLFHGTNYEIPLWRRRHTVVTVHDLSSSLVSKVTSQAVARRMRLRLPLAVKNGKGGHHAD